MARNEASERQVQAADPAHSTWLSANAGSGKTSVLTDRVARLLLEGSQPQHILCLTYTKAAAAEMQNRLFKRLGQWAMLDAASLSAQLEDLGVEATLDEATLANARRLFARAIDAPGGLKIQTIHSFCAALLRRFPLEAGVSPNFTEMDDRAAKLLRAEIVEEMAEGPERALLEKLAQLMSGEDFTPILSDLCRNSAAFATNPSRDTIQQMFGLSPGYSGADLIAQVFLGGEAELLAQLLPMLEASGTNDQRDGAKLRAITTPLDLATLPHLEAALLFGPSAADAFGAKIGKFPTAKCANGPAAALMPQLEALMRRVEAARAKRLALQAADKTLALHEFARAFLPLYGARKAQHGWLDFDDLITRSGALLTDRSVAQWVLFRLDGGIDHILVDEAQDTSPGQWQVVERLAEEFTAGEGARGLARSIFVVGDKKQSIYSFQGADLEKFEAMRAHFKARFAGAAKPWMEQELAHSFRSSEAILRLVDCTMNSFAASGLGGKTMHLAFHDTRPGRVDLWPVIEPSAAPEEGDWFDPIDLLGEQHHTVQLARRIAGEIRRMIDTGQQILTKKGPRPLHEGDFLILVQRRSALFTETIRACKEKHLAVAGADRLKLGAELAVRDLGALLAFLATPEDDLSLAAALRSPLFGWSEGELYALAQPRGPKEYLWTALRAAEAHHPKTLTILHDLRNSADFLRPFELIERILTRHDGRRRLLARLGPEAEDGIDAFLAQALAFERSEVPSLTGFLVWLETDDVEVKRQLDNESRAIRVMTVHGAKGLEAPVVILPDTTVPSPQDRDEIYVLGQDLAVWKTPVPESPEAIALHRAELKRRQVEERMRLLYVAMTRAESWLIVAAAGKVGVGAESWYSLAAEGMKAAGSEPGLSDLTADLGFGPINRLQFGTWPENALAEKPAKAPPVALPTWATARAAPAAQALPALSPSDLGGAKALAGEATARTEEEAKRYGRHLHLLLEHLPLLPAGDWPATAQGLLASLTDAPGPDQAAALLHEARGVLIAPQLAAIFAPEALVEVEILAHLPELAGRLIRGTIDRLIVSPTRVVAVDYKSNLIVPATPSEVPDGILRQLGAYASALAQIYPGRPIETAILWTKPATLMPIDPDIVRQALTRTTIP